MKVNAKVNMDVDLADVAAAMAKSPADFARFWFEFHRLTAGEKTETNPLGRPADMEPFGKAMADMAWSGAQDPFVAVADFMRYHNRKV